MIRQGDLFVHGMLQRCGSNFLANMLALHPDLNLCPRGFWEFPHLRLSKPLMQYATSLSQHPRVRDLETDEVLSYLGDGLLRMAARGTGGTDHRLLLKEPFIDNLSDVFKYFPGGYVVVIVRDGRDYAASAMRTQFAAPPKARLRSPRSWRWALRHPMSLLAERWVLASQSLVTQLQELHEAGLSSRLRVVRYEDLVAHRREIMEQLLPVFHLDVEAFPWADLDTQPVRGSSFVNNKDGKLDWNVRQMDVNDLASVERWRDWDSRALKAFESVAKKELLRWGYRVTGQNIRIDRTIPSLVTGKNDALT